jgi:hypothetical protein
METRLEIDVPSPTAIASSFAAAFKLDAGNNDPVLANERADKLLAAIQAATDFVLHGAMAHFADQSNAPASVIAAAIVQELLDHDLLG